MPSRRRQPEYAQRPDSGILKLWMICALREVSVAMASPHETSETRLLRCASCGASNRVPWAQVKRLGKTCWSGSSAWRVS
jgi:hypothetical protein